jgi:hypothetical protein
MAHARRNWMIAAAVASAGAIALGWFVMTSLTPRLDIAGTRGDPGTGDFALDGVMFRLPGGETIRIGRVEFPSLITPALAADNITLSNVSIEAGGIIYRAPTIDIVGSSLGQAEIKSFVDRTNRQPFVQRLAALSAASVTIPQAIVERPAGSRKETYELRNLTMRSVAAGKAATVTAAGGSIKGHLEETTFEAVDIRALDLVFLARLLSDAGSEREPRLLLSAATLNQVKHANQAATTTIARLALTDARLQPGSTQLRFLPALGQGKATDVVIETRLQSSPATWKIREVALVMDAPRDGIPTKYRAAVEGLTVDLAANATAAGAKDLIELGYQSVTISAVAEADWNPQTSELAVRQVSLHGADIGSMAMRATFGGATKAVFLETNPEKRLNALTVKQMSLAIEDKGLYERIVRREARKRNKSLEETRRELSIAASSTVSLMMAGFQDMAVPAALTKFAAKPGKLNVTARAKNAAGVPLADFGKRSGGQPVIAGKLDVTAAVE